MKNKKLAAFTLVEALIGVIIMMIVIGGIALSIKMGIDMYGRAEAHSELINGMRFTLDSFNREISPMLDVTREVEILSTDISNIPSVSDDNHYIYLENGSLTHRSKSGDEVLTGSEYIDRVVFSYPTDTKETGENYTLRMDLTARHERYGDAEYNTTLEKAMYNLPSKRGDNGNILRFKYTEIEVEVEDLRIFEENTSNDLSNTLGNPKGTPFEARYHLVVNGGSDIPDYDDDSLVEWFFVTLDMEGEGADRHTVVSEYWQLLDETGEPLTGRTINTGGDFTLKDADGNQTKKRYGIIEYRVTPRILDKEGNLITSGKPVWSPYAEIAAARRAFWNDEIDHLVNGSNNDLFFERTNNVTYSVNQESGEGILTLNPGKSNGNSAIFAEANLKYMKDERAFQREKCGAAFTTMTNYSIIVDAEVVLENGDTTASGYGILVNGRILNTDESSIQDNGYVFQYDRVRTSFPMRLFGNGRQAPNSSSLKGYDINISYFGAKPEIWSLPGNKDYNLQYDYVIRTMQNDTFRLGETAVKYFTKRKRVIYTILEYYSHYTKDDSNPGSYIYDAEAINKPHYIVRMRTLKNPDDILGKKSVAEQVKIREKDPWYIGTEFYDSEPIWYGDFVGAAPIKSGDLYLYDVKNYSEKFNGKKLTITTPPVDNDKGRNRNVLRLNDQMSGNDGYSIVKGYDLNIRKHLFSLWPSSSQWDKNYNDERLNKLYKPDSKRYIGVRVWSAKQTQIGVKFYEINMAPGFCGDELKAIMPKGSRLYEVKETYQTGTYENKSWDQLSDLAKDDYFSWDSTKDAQLNKHVFSKSSFHHGELVSDGDGNDENEDRNIGIMDIRHTWPLNECKCPLCKLFK